MPDAESLLQVPPPHWQVEQVIVFDWQDGPRDGLCLLREPPACLAFTAIAERPADDDLGDCLYRATLRPAATFAEVLTALADLGTPTGAVWTPVWRFPTAAQQRACEARLAELLPAAPADLVLRSRDMLVIQDAWVPLLAFEG